MRDHNILSFTPDDTASDVINGWAERESGSLSKTSFDAKEKESFVAVEGIDTKIDERLLARFINAALLADWACYSTLADRADYARLSAVIKTFPEGFRVWFCKSGDKYKPVGYTGWYPISAEAFVKADDHPDKIANRSELQPRDKVPGAKDSYIWLFNYSIIEPLRKSQQSKRMLKSYAEDLSKLNCLGMAAAILSPESERVASCLGLAYRGDMMHDGVKEKVFAIRLHPTQTAAQS